MDFPQKLGRYEIVREVGHGAMGVVYEAIDPNIGRKVALKTIRAGTLGTNAEEVAKRFKNEARAAGGLNHPNIVTIYDADEQNGILYLAMEFLQGATLDVLLHEQVTESAKELDASHVREEARSVIGSTSTPTPLRNPLPSAGHQLTNPGGGFTHAAQI